MCQYSARFAGGRHAVHLGSRVVGGAGLVMVDARCAESRGRSQLGASLEHCEIEFLLADPRR
jgi:hypothetical protein